jgi:hypothetical protein
MAAERSTWTDSRLDDLKETVVGIDEKVTRLETKVDEGFLRLDTKVDDGFVRLDTKMDEGFVRLDSKMDEGFARLDAKIDAGLGRLDGRIDSLNQSLVHGMIALISIIAVLLAAFLTVVATHL